MLRVLRGGNSLMKHQKLKIGKLELKSNVLVAPLAGYTNLATRLIYREQNPGVMYAEMVSALGLEYNYSKSSKLIKSENSDFPLGVQLFGPNAETILKAFLKIKNDAFDLIDINAGCSVRKILNSNSGACLLKKPDEIRNIILKLKENTDKPVTLKIRSGWDGKTINFLEVLDAAAGAKADLITFHPRTRAMIFKGKADWDQIKIMKEKSNIPVIGNGDIFSDNDAVRMIQETGCDGVMIARGLIENPFLIEEVISAFKEEIYKPADAERRIRTLIRHCGLTVEYLGERRGIVEFRKFARGYLKGLENSSKVKEAINKIYTFNEFKKIIDDYYNYLTNKNFQKI